MSHGCKSASALLLGGEQQDRVRPRNCSSAPASTGVTRAATRSGRQANSGPGWPFNSAKFRPNRSVRRSEVEGHAGQAQVGDRPRITSEEFRLALAVAALGDSTGLESRSHLARQTPWDGPAVERACAPRCPNANQAAVDQSCLRRTSRRATKAAFITTSEAGYSQVTRLRFCSARIASSHLRTLIA